VTACGARSYFLLEMSEPELLFSDEAELLLPELSDLLSDLPSEDEDGDPLALEEPPVDDFFA
jgi:hypothetical protein